MHQLFRIFRYLRPYWKRLLLASVCLLLGIPASLFHPLVWMFVVDEVILAEQPKFIEHVDGDRVRLLLAAVGAMFLVHTFSVALSSTRSYLLGTVGQALVRDLRSDLYAKVQSHALPFFHQHSTGDLIARSMGDVDALEEVALRGTDDIVSSALQFVGVACIIVWLHPIVGALTLAPMLAVIILVRLFNARVRGLYRSVRDRLGDVNSKLQENLTGILIIKAFGREPYEAARFNQQNQNYYDTSIRAVIARSIYFPAVFTVGFITNMIMIGVGGYFVLQGQMKIGVLVAYRGYWWQLFSPVQSLARINEMIQRALAAASRVFELMDEPVKITDSPDATAIDHVRGTIEFRDVTFHYESRQRTIEHVSFLVNAGEQIGVVGPSGAGKSTLLSLLLRLYDPVGGQVLIDGRDVRDVTQASLRRHFGIVTQEPFLFNDTVRANVLYARPDATEEQMYEAARQANAHEFILSLPQGYDTLVGERGVKLSGGQKQRISIARAMLADPRILILDEATASVEPESEGIIQSAVQHASAGRTAVVVSHRLSMVRSCDQILVLEDGRITERGTHEQLMSRGGWYARMYRLQMGEAAVDDGAN